jgi:hypothetical protein
MSATVGASGPLDAGATQDLDMKVYGSGGWTADGFVGDDSYITYSISISGSIATSIYFWPDDPFAYSALATASENINAQSGAAYLDTNYMIAGSVGFSQADGVGGWSTPSLTYNSAMDLSSSTLSDTYVGADYSISYSSGNYYINGTSVSASGSIEGIGSATASMDSDDGSYCVASVSGSGSGTITVGIQK